MAFKDIAFVLLKDTDSVEGDVFRPAKHVELKSEHYANVVEMQTKIEEVHAFDDCAEDFFTLSAEDRFVSFKVNLAGHKLTIDNIPETFDVNENTFSKNNMLKYFYRLIYATLHRQRRALCNKRSLQGGVYYCREAVGRLCRRSWAHSYTTIKIAVQYQRRSCE